MGDLAAEYSSRPVTPAVAGTIYLTTDHLGSTRVVTDSSATPVAVARHDYRPFGEEISFSASNPRQGVQGYAQDAGVRQEFTGQERDPETGLDYFEARYFSSAQGRFTGPDDPLADQWEEDPQSWNLYSYGRNNPLRYVDPTGRACVVDPKTGAEHDDDRGGQSCADARKESENNRISATAYGGPAAAVQEVDDALHAFLGNGPKEIEYGPDDPFTLDFQKSAGMDAIAQRIKSRCSQKSGRIAVGTGEAFVNTVIDGIAGGAGFHTPEAQLGAFNATYTHGGGTAEITVTNPISLNSLFLHAPAKWFGIKNPKTGPFGTVHQTLHIIALDPCDSIAYGH
jgi:RHS repeat-associated protein